MSSQINLVVDPVIRTRPRTPLSIQPDASIRDAMSALRDACRGCLLVCHDRQILGIFTERDALRLMAADADFDRPVGSAMQFPVITVKQNEPVSKAIALMLRGGYRRLPVLDDTGDAVGIFTVRTLLHYIVEHFSGVVYTLPPEPHYATHLREGA